LYHLDKKINKGGITGDQGKDRKGEEVRGQRNPRGRGSISPSYWYLSKHKPAFFLSLFHSRRAADDTGKTKQQRF
jgi:hypothetical protein